jgi:hypothetical protein
LGGVGGGGGGVGEGKSQIWQVEQFSHFPHLAQEQLRGLPAPPVQTQNGGFSVKHDGAAANLTACLGAMSAKANIHVPQSRSSLQTWQQLDWV